MPELQVRQIRGNDQGHNVPYGFQADNVGLFRAPWRKVRQPFHRHFYIISNLRLVDEILQFHGDRTGILIGAGSNAFYPVYPDDSFFNPSRDALFYL